LNNRIKRALKLRQQGLSFNQIGQDLGIGSEHTRQIIRKYQRHLKLLENPFALKIKELNRMRDATRILNALKDNDFYDGDPERLAITSRKIYGK
jgi:orotate phosphoribosyltransferase-like protein